MRIASKECEVCFVKYYRKPSVHKGSWEKSKFCSTKCSNTRPNAGTYKKRHTATANSGSFKSGTIPWNFKGDLVGYDALHAWVYRKLGKPEKCELCLRTGLSGHMIHWANKTGKYIRNEFDWIRLCAKCHRTYDKVNKLYNSPHKPYRK